MPFKKQKINQGEKRKNMFKDPNQVKKQKQLQPTKSETEYPLWRL